MLGSLYACDVSYLIVVCEILICFGGDDTYMLVMFLIVVCEILICFGGDDTYMFMLCDASYDV